MMIALLIFAVATTQGGALVGFFLAITAGCHGTLPNVFWAEMHGTAHLGAIKALVVAIIVLGSAIGPGVTGI